MKVRLWRVETNEGLTEIAPRPLDLESRLEAWLTSDIGIVDTGLLTIGRQVETAFGGFIDLLCIDGNGDLVIVELKRDKTPREITAQVLDYASWIRELSNDQITRIADAYLTRTSGRDLITAFRERFGAEPESLNQNHKMLIVGSLIDSGSERIIKYLSDAYGVNINAVTFQFFCGTDGSEHLARVFLQEPESVERVSSERGASRRRIRPSLEEYAEMAAEKGVGELYATIVEGLRGVLTPYSMVTSVAFYGKLDGGSKSIFSLLPAKSSVEQGLQYQVYIWRLARLLGRDVKEIEGHLPNDRRNWTYYANAEQDFTGYEGCFRSLTEVQHFLNLVRVHSPAIGAPNTEALTDG